MNQVLPSSRIFLIMTCLDNNLPDSIMARHVNDGNFPATGQAKVSQVLLHRRERVNSFAGDAVHQPAEEHRLANVTGSGDQHSTPA